MITTPAAAPQRKSLMKKQIPTLLGLVVLVVGLIIGGVLFTQGTGVFLPRATPETTPRSIRVSNLTDQGFSISFMTDAATSGFVRYGTDPDDLTQIGDQRDQLTGTVGEYTLHHISVLRGLEPNTTYYYVLGTGKGALFDDNGEPFTITTAKQAGTQPRAMTVFGSAETPSGAPAVGSVVFVTPPDAGTLSSLVTQTGSWAVSLSTARTKDGSDYATVELGDELAIQVLTVDPKDATQLVATVEPETEIAIILGTNESTVSTPVPLTVDPTDATEATESAEPEATFVNLSDSSDASDSATAGGLATLVLDTEVELVTMLELTEEAPATGSALPIVETSTPIITGVAKPNVTITVSVHSDTQLETQIAADENGNFELDISQYEKVLEPGEHTITYSYVDPTSGETITQTRSFTVAPRVTLAAVTATPTPTPFSSTNPYPIADSTPATGTGSALVTPTPTATSTMSGSLATRSANVSTGSGMPTSGSVGTTLLLIGAGIFFLVSGFWSWWISKELVGAYEE